MALIEFKDLPDTTTPLNASNLNNNFNECYKEDTGWQNIEYLNTYSSYNANAYNPLQYRKIGNQVFIRGMITSSTTGAVGWYATAGALPSSARPRKSVYCIADDSGTAIGVSVQNDDGGIRVFNVSTGWISLDNINFFID